MSRSALKVALAFVALGVIAVGGWRAWVMYGGSGDELIVPEFEEMGAGPRAPSSEAFGVKVGFSSLTDVESLVSRRGLTCEDTSVRALMKKMRDKKRQELAEKKARGEKPDDASGASWLNKKSPKEKNPQVRLSCPETVGADLADRERPRSSGRLLFVFDSAELPLRHVSFRRLQRDHTQALADFQDALAAMTAIYGEPTDVVGEMPVPGPDGADAQFPKLKPIKRQWNFADVHVKVNALNFGKRGVDILESVEVPLPVRPDAPSLPR